VVARVLNGIKREQAEAAATAAKSGAVTVPTVELTPALLAIMGRAVGEQSSDPDAQMHWAAATCAVYGMFRPSEVLGSHISPDRALGPESIVFYRNGKRMDLFASGVSPLSGVQPSYFTVQLFISKTVQFRQSDPHPIAARAAVQAMWIWMHTRRALVGQLCTAPWDGRLFHIPHEKRLSQRRLIAVLEAAAFASTGERCRFTGKSFRRGGASALMAAGASSSDMQAAGRWRSAAMPGVYATSQSKRERMLAVSSQLMGSAAAFFAGVESVRRT
jgi:hypothetical protein